MRTVRITISQSEHDPFCTELPNASRQHRRRRLQFIESVGLESALWPNLFWITEATLTHSRATDVRRWKPSTIEEMIYSASEHKEEFADDFWLPVQDNIFVPCSRARFWTAVLLLLCCSLSMTFYRGVLWAQKKWHARLCI